MTDPLYLRCECFTPYHCLVVDRDGSSFDVRFVAESNGRFWHRVKYALRHIFKLDMLVEADMILTAKDAQRLRDFIGEAK